MKRPTLIVITGATGSGKTALAIEVAQRLGCHIISADSRQIYRGIPIATAAPTPEQLAAVHHHFVGMLDLDQYYSAAQFESDVMALLPQLWDDNEYAVMCGGSMMYIDAVTRGIDELPTVSDEVRRHSYNIYKEHGIERLRDELRRVDPVTYDRIDRNNHKRMIHALEVTLQAGVPYSSLCTGRVKERPFRVVKVAIDYPRDTLFDRINRRVLQMVADGLEAEARSVYHLRHLNSLNTVGIKEMFALFDGLMDRPTAISRMQKNTRVYAKKQLTWLRRLNDTLMLPPMATADDVLELL
ncbi:MAG: tRNA (adenosine(37)-N6)-dimethylallyltransferase MiaA [Paramuribaculum sp.]